MSLNNVNGFGSSQPLSNIDQNIGSSAADRLARKDLSGQGVSQLLKQGSGAETASLSVTAGVLASALSGNDVRTERVSAVQQSIAAGTYDVSASDLAGKMLHALLN